jgi:hypothetical protein
MQDAPQEQQNRRRSHAVREGAKTQLLNDFEAFLASPAAASPENAPSDSAANLLQRFYRQQD